MGIEPEGREELAVMLGAARLQHVEIRLREARMRLLINRVERVHEAIAERIGVDVERRMNEMRDVGPERLIAFAETDRGAEALALYGEPGRADLVGGELARLALHMNVALEGIEGDLAHDRVDHVLDLLRQHHLAQRLVPRLVEKLAE